MGVTALENFLASIFSRNIKLIKIQWSLKYSIMKINVRSMENPVDFFVPIKESLSSK